MILFMTMNEHKKMTKVLNIIIMHIHFKSPNFTNSTASQTLPDSSKIVKKGESRDLSTEWDTKACFPEFPDPEICRLRQIHQKHHQTSISLRHILIAIVSSKSMCFSRHQASFKIPRIHSSALFQFRSLTNIQKTRVWSFGEKRGKMPKKWSNLAIVIIIIS